MGKQTATPTERELEVLDALVEHGKLEDAAKAIFMAKDTMKWHVARMKRRYGRHYLHQLTAYAERRGWVRAHVGHVAPPVAQSSELYLPGIMAVRFPEKMAA